MTNSLPELADDGGENLLGESQVFDQGAFGGSQVSAQNRVDDPEVLAQPKLALSDRVKRADKLELNDEVDEPGTFLKE